QVRIRYGDNACASERVLNPLGLVAKGSVWYLVAQIDGSIRSYRVSRVQEAAILDEPFVRPAEFDLERFWEESATRFKDRLRRFKDGVRRWKGGIGGGAAVVDWLGRTIRFGAVDAVDGDGVHLHFDAEEVARITLLGLGDQVEIVEPQSLRDSILAAARAVVN